jgi:AraC-like DNA-binding protein
VVLGAEEGAVVFPAALLDRPSPAAEPELLAVHEKLALQKMADLARQDFLLTLERELGSLLEQGDASVDALAARVGRKPRALRAELDEAGTSFKQLLAGYRERLSRRLLARTQEPIDQILYLTGFSEPAAFTRAFKRWTGETPSAYRKRKQSENPDS